MPTKLPIVVPEGPGGCMRVIVELHRTEADTVHGVVITDAKDVGEPHRFTGWLDLLRILEALAPPTTSTSRGDSTARPP